MVMGTAAPGDQRLRGRVGIITGAASGIGAAGADLFAAHGRPWSSSTRTGTGASGWRTRSRRGAAGLSVPVLSAPR